MAQDLLHQCSVDFGNTDQAGFVPEHLAPSAGPVYLEGRLVLSLSFQKTNACIATKPPKDETLLASYLVWDEVAKKPYEKCRIELRRYENTDLVLKEGYPVWLGTVDTKRRIIKVPDLDTAGFLKNQEGDLCWKNA